MSPTTEITMVLAPTILIPLMLLGGLFVNNSTIPASLQWMKYLSWFMYGNEALLINQWEGVDNIKYTCPSPSGQVNCTVTGEYVLEKLHFSKVPMIILYPQLLHNFA